MYTSVLCVCPLLDTKRYKEAEDSFIELERLAPNAIESILFIRGTNYLAMKDYEKAQLCLAAALQSNPDDESTLVNYGGLHVLGTHT